MLNRDSNKTAASDIDGLQLRTELLNYKYKVLYQLGKGGFGEILKIIDVESNKIFALKKQLKQHEK